MKKQLLFLGSIIIVLVLLLSGCQESTEDNNTSGFSAYENTEKGFSIEYPTTWNMYENPTQAPGVDTLFSSPSNEPTKTGNLMVSVMGDVSMTMDEFKEAHIENLSVLLSDFSITSQNATTLSDLPGYELVFTFTSEGYTWRQLETWTISDNTLYLLVHQADQANYETFVDDIQHMINSFSIEG